MQRVPSTKPQQGWYSAQQHKLECDIAFIHQFQKLDSGPVTGSSERGPFVVQQLAMMIEVQTDFRQSMSCCTLSPSDTNTVSCGTQYGCALLTNLVSIWYQVNTQTISPIPIPILLLKAANVIWCGREQYFCLLEKNNATLLALCHDPVASVIGRTCVLSAWEQSRLGEAPGAQSKMWKEQCLQEHVSSLIKWVQVGHPVHQSDTSTSTCGVSTTLLGFDAETILVSISD